MNMNEAFEKVWRAGGKGEERREKDKSKHEIHCRPLAEQSNGTA